MTRRRPDFEPGAAGAEAAKLKKFSDGVPANVSLEGVGCRRVQKRWLPDAVRNQFLSSFVYTYFEWGIDLTGANELR